MGMTKFRKENTDKLLELYYSGKLDDESKEIVQGWLFSDDNRKAKDANIALLFEKIMKEKRKPDDYTYRSLAVLQEELGFTDRRIKPSVIPLVQRRSLAFFYGVAVVAAIMLGVFIFPKEFKTMPDRMPEQVPVAEITVSAEVETTKDIILPDGSSVKLKGATTITLAENFAENRRVKIDGEAYFIVARDEVHPFIVEGSDVMVTVLGTEFNIRAFESDSYAEVVLTTGKLKVCSGDASVTLNLSERAIINKARHQIDLQEIGEGELLRLRGINLSLNDVTLDEAFRMIGGYFNVTMKVSTNVPDVDGIMINLHDDATLNETLFLLRAVNPVFDYHIEGSEVTIIKVK